MVALSFVRTPEDIDECRRRCRSGRVVARSSPSSKKPEADRRLDAILDKTDGVMVARGDLAWKIPPEKCRRFRRIIPARHQRGHAGDRRHQCSTR